MRDSKDSGFDFKSHGYVNSADWARLHDLLPDDLTKREAQILKDYDGKANVCGVLESRGIAFSRYFDAKEASVRNVV